MRKLVSCVNGVLYDIRYAITYFIKSNMYNIAVVTEILLPYIMMNIAYSLYQSRNGVYVGSEVIVPLLVLFVCNVVKRMGNKSGNGSEIPIPAKRFTRLDEDVVEVEPEDLEEMLLYVYEVEEYLKRTGKVR